ncbi:hypothetical protein NNO07_22670 [Pseudomonas resinovorans]|uniref:Uncharacterized protein n=1 Tax=Metapseudomonas resinovorans TaxID=53412 RepID=A0ABT4YAH4_METRE|nr:hypothetical protein [Pseudomonas resinovorans]MDA8485881.1 hypothetical protein [Pseudomonas resinovorans]
MRIHPKIIALFFATLSTSANAEFIHPLDFNNSEEQKEKVIEWIVNDVKETYCDGPLKMCQASTLRTMEKAEISAFKELTQAKERAILDNVIKTYCDGPIDMCSYSNLAAMYEQELEASAEKAHW